MAKKNKDKGMQLSILLLLLLGSALLALWLFWNSSPDWDPTGDRRFREWRFGSVIGAVLLILNVVAWRSLRKAGDKAAKAKTWPIWYAIAWAVLVGPWLYFFSNGTSRYDILIVNEGERPVYGTTVSGRNFRLGNDTVWPKQDLRRTGIRTPFPKDGVVTWTRESAGAPGRPGSKPSEVALPARPNGSSRLLQIMINGGEARVAWQ